MNRLIMSNLDSSRIKERIRREKMNKKMVTLEMKKLSNEFLKARIVEPSLIPPDVITMNSIVRLSDTEHNESITIQLVYPEDANVNEKKISVFAPIGSSILGNKQGSIIRLKEPIGDIKLHIDEIIYQPESAGDFHL